MRVLLFFIILSFSFFQVNGQVYLIQNLDNQMALGPENISGVTPSVSAHYILQLQNYQKALQGEITKKISEVEALKIKGKSKKERKEIEKGISFIGEEIITLSKLVEKWEERPNNLANELQFYNEWRKNPCYNITTASGTYSPKEYDVELIKGEYNGIFTENIHIVSLASESQWKKTYKKNCHPKESKDCIVYCMVETGERHQIYGFTGLLYEIKDFPSDFLNSDNSILTRINNYTDENPKIKILLKETEEVVNIQKWKIVDCN